MNLRINKQWIFVFLSSIVASFIEFSSINVEGCELMPLVPLTYAISITLSRAGNELFTSQRPGMSIVNGLYYIKSVIYTLLQSLSDNVSSAFFSPTKQELYLASIFCIGEIIFIYILYWWFNRGKKIENGYTTQTFNIQTTSSGQNIILFAFFSFVLILVIISPSILYKYNFFTVSSISIIQDSASRITASSFSSIMVEWAKTLLPVVVGIWANKKYHESKRIIYIYSAMILLCLLSMIVTGVSRSSFVVTGLSSCFLLLHLFPNKEKPIKTVFGIVIAIVFVFFTITKFSNFLGFGAVSGNKLENMTETLQAYFCGIINNAAAIRTREVFINQIDINTFLSDLFDNWMGIGQLFRGHTNITEYFNQTIYGGVLANDQIVPTIGQSYIQFGIIGVYGYTAIMVYIIMKFDRLMKSCSRIEYYYLFLLVSIKCAVTLMGNFKIFMASVLNTFIPLFLFFTINRTAELR